MTEGVFSLEKSIGPDRGRLIWFRLSPALYVWSVIKLPSNRHFCFEAELVTKPCD